MSIYFDVKTIRELLYDNNRETREFTLDELSQYDGSNGKPAYVALNGIVYDLSKVKAWSGGKHFGIVAGKDLTDRFNICHEGMLNLINQLPIVGKIK